MKLLDITWKDLRQSARSLQIFVFMFGAPILVTLLFYFMFGSMGEEQGFELPQTTVVVANLDQTRLDQGVGGMLEAAAGADPGSEDASASGSQTMGDLLIGILSMEEFGELMDVSVLHGDGDQAEAAINQVRNQEAGVALVIPPGFGGAILSGDARAEVKSYKDSTLIIGPAIVEGIVSQLLDAFAAGRITTELALESLIEAGVPLDEAVVREVIAQATAVQGGNLQEVATVQAPAGDEEGGNIVGEILGTIMGGMMVFFAFYTGAGSMETVLVEEERGTLARLFTTPTSHLTILGGKFLTGVINLVVQIAVLMTFGSLIFKVDWGDPLPVLVAALGIIIIAASMGVFLVSLMRNTRQSGVIFGGALTITGMLGLIPVFTAGVPNQPESIKAMSLIVPHGWAMRGLTTAMEGGVLSDILPTFGVILLWSIFFFGIGQHRMRKRFR